MKNYVKALLGLMLVCFVFSNTAVAQSLSEKALLKTAKAAAKKAAAEGWKSDGSLTLEMIYFEHYKKVSAEGCSEIVGNAEGNVSVKTVNQGKQWARNNASLSYAKEKSQSIRARFEGDGSAGTENIPSFEKFYEAYEGLVQKTIHGALKHSFTLFKNKSNGYMDCRSYFIVNEEAAKNAQLVAAEQAAKEAEMARTEAEKISQFIKEGFE